MISDVRHPSKKLFRPFGPPFGLKIRGVGSSPGSVTDNLPDIGCPFKSMYDHVKVPQYDEMNFAQGQLCKCHNRNQCVS